MYMTGGQRRRRRAPYTIHDAPRLRARRKGSDVETAVKLAERTKLNFSLVWMLCHLNPVEVDKYNIHTINI
jgi:hypothetical protein